MITGDEQVKNDIAFSADAMVTQYIEWLKKGISAYTFENGVIEINSPFYDRHNDHLQVFVIKKNNDFIITDDGYTLSDLENTGLEINTETRKKILMTTLHGYGISLGNENELYVISDISDFAKKKHSLIQAMLAVNDMYVLTSSSVISLFKQDVEIFLRENHIRFVKDATFYGKSGLSHNFDFVISASDHSCERLIKTTTRIDSSTVPNILFTWNELLDSRGNIQKLFWFTDAEKDKISPKYIDALTNYNINLVPWANRQSFVGDLAS